MKHAILAALVLVAACSSPPDGTDQDMNVVDSNSGMVGCPELVLVVNDVDYCLQEQVDAEVSDCPPDYPFLFDDSWSFFVCAAEDPGETQPSEVYAAYEAEVCAPATDESTCESNRCDWIPADSRWFYESAMCTASAEGICVASVGSYNNALGCQTRVVAEGRIEVIRTSSLLVEAGWQSEVPDGTPGPCSCLDGGGV